MTLSCFALSHNYHLDALALRLVACLLAFPAYTVLDDIDTSQNLLTYTFHVFVVFICVGYGTILWHNSNVIKINHEGRTLGLSPA